MAFELEVEPGLGKPLGQLEDLLEPRHPGCLPLQVRPVHLSDWTPLELKVVVDGQHPIAGTLQVELEAIQTRLEGPSEGLQGVFPGLLGRATVSQQQGFSKHHLRQILRHG
jgi:hypothetical protein